MAGRQAKYPFLPSMRRSCRTAHKKTECRDALQSLVSRIVQSDIADVERLKYFEGKMVSAKRETVGSAKRLLSAMREFTDELRHVSPIIADLSIRDCSNDPGRISDAIYNRLKDTALRRIPPNLLDMILERPHNCPFCGQHTELHRGSVALR